VCTIDTNQQTSLSGSIKNALKQKADAMAEGIKAPVVKAEVKSNIANIIAQSNFQSAAGEVISIMAQTSVQDFSANSGEIAGQNIEINQKMDSVTDGLLQSKQLQDTVQKVANAIDSAAESKSTGIKGGEIAAIVVSIVVFIIIIIAIVIFVRYKMAMARTQVPQQQPPMFGMW
jgi:hypothetical protein